MAFSVAAVPSRLHFGKCGGVIPALACALLHVTLSTFRYVINLDDFCTESRFKLPTLPKRCNL